MGDNHRQEWVVVAEFSALDTGVAADLAIAKLQASAIPAVRFPTGSVTSVLGGAVPAVEPIRVVVPPEQEDQAREILAERFDDDVLADQ